MKVSFKFDYSFNDEELKYLQTAYKEYRAEEELWEKPVDIYTFRQWLRYDVCELTAWKSIHARLAHEINKKLKKI